MPRGEHLGADDQQRHEIEGHEQKERHTTGGERSHTMVPTAMTTHMPVLAVISWRATSKAPFDRAHSGRGTSDRPYSGIARR